MQDPCRRKTPRWVIEPKETKFKKAYYVGVNRHALYRCEIKIRMNGIHKNKTKWDQWKWNSAPFIKMVGLNVYNIVLFTWMSKKWTHCSRSIKWANPINKSSNYVSESLNLKADNILVLFYISLCDVVNNQTH